MMSYPLPLHDTMFNLFDIRTTTQEIYTPLVMATSALAKGWQTQTQKAVLRDRSAPRHKTWAN